MASISHLLKCASLHGKLHLPALARRSHDISCSATSQFIDVACSPAAFAGGVLMAGVILVHHLPGAHLMLKYWNPCKLGLTLLSTSTMVMVLLISQ